MNSKVKALVVVLSAAVTVGAVGILQAASASQNIQHTFSSSKNSTILTAEVEAGTEHRFILGPSTDECKTALGVGTMPATTADTITLRPTYGECQGTVGAGKFAATLTNDGCAWVLDSDTTTSSHLSGEHASVSLECEHKHEITTTSMGCVVGIGDTHPPSGGTVNQGLHGVTFASIENGKALTVTWKVRTLTYTTQGANCALLGIPAGTYTNGQIEGVTIIRGYEDTGFTGSLTNGFSVTEGIQVTLGLTTP